MITRSEPGGAQTIVRDLARTQMENGLRVAIAAGPEGAGSAWRGLPPELGTITIPHLIRAVKPASDFLAWRQIRHTLSQYEPDILHLHTSKAAALGRIVGFPRKRIVYTMHGFEQLSAENTRLLRIDRLLARRTGAVVAVSESDRIAMQALGYHARVVHNGCRDALDTVAFGPEAELMRSLREQGKRICLMVAREARPKRIDLAREVAARCPADVVIVWVGGEPKPGDPSAFVALGTVAAPPLMPLADCFLLLSDHEGLPASLLEALSAGLPSVVSDLPAMREVLSGSDAGILTANKATHVAEAIRLLLEDVPRHGTVARLLWESEFSAARMTAEYQIIYDRLIANSSAG